MATATERIHRVKSHDGTEIVGRIEGEGPPLVLVHGGLGDGETSWRFMAPLLTDRFSCHAISTRGRGLSGGSPDHSRQRLHEDIAAYVESLDESAFLFGHSSGGAYSMGAAALIPDRVAKLALYEPPVDMARPSDVNEQVMAAIARDDRTEVLRLVLEAIRLNESDQAIFMSPPGLDVGLQNLDAALQEGEAIGEPIPDEAFVRLTMPVLLLRGSESHENFAAAIAYLQDRLSHAEVTRVEGMGHVGTILNAQEVARVLSTFFAD